jgi:hypothetical protein
MYNPVGGRNINLVSNSTIPFVVTKALKQGLITIKFSGYKPIEQIHIAISNYIKITSLCLYDFQFQRYDLFKFELIFNFL